MVKTLAVAEYAKQLCMIVDMCNALAARNCDNMKSSGPEKAAQMKLFYSSFQSALSGDCADATEDATSSEPFSAMATLFTSYVESSEQALHCALFPPLSLHGWKIPSFEHHMHSSAHFTEPSCPEVLTYAPEDELLVAEYLLSLVGQTVGVKRVKLSSPTGTEYVVLYNCIPAEELHRTLQLWRELYVQHESALTQRLAAKRVADRLKAAAAVKAASSSSIATTTATGATSTTAAAAATGATTDVEPLQLGIADDDVETFDYDTPTVGRNTHNTATTLSLATYAVLKRANCILKLDITCATKEVLRRLLAWLSDELQLVYEVTRPGEYAFSAAQRFYCPHHPWEVTIYICIYITLVQYCSVMIIFVRVFRRIILFVRFEIDKITA